MKHSEIVSLFVSCPKGLQYILEKELSELGVTSTKAIPSGVYCSADVMTMYRTLLWSRIANRVFLILDEAKVDSVEDIYQLASRTCWSDHFDENASFSVSFKGTNAFITNSNFGAMKIKDAVVDHFRDKFGVRPSVNKTEPSYRLVGRLTKGRLLLGIDLSGESLHKRGYRLDTGKAPMKENLAAGLLLLSGWPEKFSANAGFIDPMCGSGTLLIEAAHIVLKYAPGSVRERWGFSEWKQHEGELWSQLLIEAKKSHEDATASFSGRLVGFDADSMVVRKAQHNIESAGLASFVHVEKRALEDFSLFEKLAPGLLLTNPPYGERLGEVEALEPLYRLLGAQFENFLLDWKAGVFTGNMALGKKIGWRSYKQYKLYNGAIESDLILFDLVKENRFKDEWLSPEKKLLNPKLWKVSNESRAQMFNNRILKNVKNMSKWAKKNKVSCYRLYDADMPEFSLALDLYEEVSGERWFHVQEYVAPKTIEENVSIERLSEALAVLPSALGIDPDKIVLKRRAIQKGSSQYNKLSNDKHSFIVNEYDARLQINLRDYLDTGLFLDHRAVRRWIKANSGGKRFLNLFSYTGSVTLNAVLGGAVSSLSVDMSNTYLDWAKENLVLNAVNSPEHKFLQADCLAWLKSPESDGLFDLVFMDPPSFSNSKRMDGVLDVQRDHEQLIDAAMKKLAPEGVLVFSNNYRKFKMSVSVMERFEVVDWTRESIDKDFERNSNIHKCWMIKAKIGR